VADAQVHAEAARIAAQLAALPPEAVRATKALLKAPHRDAVVRQLRAESDIFREMLARPAAREALAAFLARRAR
jgi:enoyl-CoA hydratase/carnithine racemase